MTESSKGMCYPDVNADRQSLCNRDEALAVFPKRRQQGRPSCRGPASVHNLNFGLSSGRYITAVLCCSVFFFQRTAAFPKEAVGWTQLSRAPSSAYRQQQQQQQQELRTPTQQPSSCLARVQRLQDNVHTSLTLLEMYRGRPNNYNNGNGGRSDDSDSSSGGDKSSNFNFGKKKGARKQTQRFSPGRGFGRRGGANTTTGVLEAPRSSKEASTTSSGRDKEMTQRLTQLEHLVAKQTVEIRRLQEECRDLKEVSSAFNQVLEMLREAGLETDKMPDEISLAAKAEERKKANTETDTPLLVVDDTNFDESARSDEDTEEEQVLYEYFDDTEIFGEAPSSVTDAADAAGAAILAGLLGGKQRMLVDVRDSELSRDADTLVQFIELAILPVAAGLEGLRSNRNRVKMVFPTVSQLLEYRRTMALAAPEVVALSTLGFDPVQESDNIVVIVAPPPDDEEGLKAMNELLEPPEKGKQIRQPVVVLNHHMVPLSGPAADYDVMYHLRLLSVQYMSGDRADDIFSPLEELPSTEEPSDDATTGNMTVNAEEELLEAAMKHAHAVGVNRGLTRAMVIRSYPKPWHVFVDVSPATDADFVVAATFDNEPGMEDVNTAIVECLEGSEREDEIVAQQMQQALDMENSQLDTLMNRNDNNDVDGEEDDDDDFDDDLYDLWNEDSV